MNSNAVKKRKLNVSRLQERNRLAPLFQLLTESHLDPIPESSRDDKNIESIITKEEISIISSGNNSDEIVFQCIVEGHRDSINTNNKDYSDNDVF